MTVKKLPRPSDLYHFAYSIDLDEDGTRYRLEFHFEPKDRTASLRHRLDDRFAWDFLHARWRTYLPNDGLQLVEVSGGDLRFGPGQTATAEGFDAFPNRSIGGFVYLRDPIEGDFDMRCSMWARDQTDSGDPPAFGLWGGLYAAVAPDAVESWVHMMRGAATVSSPRVNGSSANSDGTSRFDTSLSNASTPFRGDLRMIRTGNLFTLQHRPYVADQAIESDVGWLTLNGTAYNTSADPLPSELYCGIGIRYSGASFEDFLARVGDFRITLGSVNESTDGAWYLDVYDATGSLVIGGLKLAIGPDKFKPYRHLDNCPQGTLDVIDTSFAGIEATAADFGSRVVARYTPPGG